MIDPRGVPRYLTSIVSSSLPWLSEHEREAIWDQASLRLSERSGRSAAPAMNRTFKITDNLSIDLHEPSLTEDNLGLKTWTSSLLLARRLPSLQHYVPTDSRMLELGSGTGLVGLAAASLWQDHLSELFLTDLPEIVPNLQRNISQTIHQEFCGETHCRALDWTDELDCPRSQTERFNVIIAADPIYSPDHSRMLATTIDRWLAQDASATFILELPLRDAYVKERDDLRLRLSSFLHLREEGQETGYDDWIDSQGQPAEVKCSWSVWQRTMSFQQI